MAIFISFILILGLVFLFPTIRDRRKGRIGDDDNQTIVPQIERLIDTAETGISGTAAPKGFTTTTIATSGVATITPAPDKPNEP
jgi:hypothetical protein